MSSQPMNLHFLIIGSGSIGCRHAENLSHLGVKISMHDLNQENLIKLCKQFSYIPENDLDEALKKNYYDAVIICTPTSFHLEHAKHAANAGCHIFIEKPISNNLDGLLEFQEFVEKKQIITLVGCNFRFHPGMKKIHTLIAEGVIGKIISARSQFGQYLPDWHPWADYRNSYSAQKVQGGGVILDRIHEIDYMRWLFGEVTEVTAMVDHLSQLEIDTEDVAEILMKFKNGSIGSIHLDYIRRIYDASLEIIGENGIIRWKFQDHFVEWYIANEKRWQSIKWEKIDNNQMYLDEMTHFLKTIDNHEMSIFPVRDAIQVLKVALTVKKAAQERKTIAL